MAITIEEIQKKEFNTRQKGYDKFEVDSFLEDIMMHLDTKENELNELRQKCSTLYETINVYKQTEDSMKEILLFAKEKRDEIIQSATNEAEEMLAKATEQAESITGGAQAQIAGIVDEATANAEQIVARATEQAEAILSGAQEEAENLLADAKERSGEMLSGLDEKVVALREETEWITQQYETVKAQFKAMLKEQLAVIDGYTEQEPEQAEEEAAVAELQEEPTQESEE